MSVQLTKDADKTLCEIYAAYLNRRANGESKRAAKDFPEESQFPDPDWATPDGAESLAELKRAGLLKLYIYGGFCLFLEITAVDAVLFVDGDNALFDDFHFSKFHSNFLSFTLRFEIIKISAISMKLKW